MKKLMIIGLAVLLSCPGAFAQQKQLAGPNYELAEQFTSKKVDKMVFSIKAKPQWFAGSDRFWYEWKTSYGKQYYIVDAATGIKMPENSKNVLKGKLSNEEMFHFAASCCGVNADSFKAELYLNKVGWKTAIETIIGNNDGIKGVKAKVEKKDAIKEEKKSKNTEKQVKVKPVKEKESSIKSSSKNDSRSIAIIGIKGRVSKEWNSYKACEDETGAGHGTVSQYFSGKVKSVKGWTLYKKGEEPKERKEVKIAKKSSRKMPILQVRINKTGKEKVMGKFNSITEAANATGIKHSSISKAISGTYNTAGGCKWRKAYGEA